MIRFLAYMQIQLYNGRWTWRPMIVTGILVPILSMTLMIAIRGTAGTPQANAYVLTGAITMSLVFECLGRVSQNIAFMRATGGLNFYRTMPGHLSALIVATLTSFFVLAMIPMCACLIFGVLVYQIRLTISPLALISVPLASISVASIGAVIGVCARSQEAASAYSLGTTMLAVFLGPVFLPQSSLPEIFKPLAWLSPASYASSAIRQTLTGGMGWTFLIDTAVLIVILAVALYVVNRKVVADV